MKQVSHERLVDFGMCLGMPGEKQKKCARGLALTGRSAKTYAVGRLENCGCCASFDNVNDGEFVKVRSAKR